MNASRKCVQIIRVRRAHRELGDLLRPNKRTAVLLTAWLRARCSFLADLGFSENPNATEFVMDTKVSDELLSKIDADVLILGQSAAASEAEMQELTGRDLFQNLGAVSSGQFVQLPPKTDDGGDLLWAITTADPSAMLGRSNASFPRLRTCSNSGRGLSRHHGSSSPWCRDS